MLAEAALNYDFASKDLDDDADDGRLKRRQRHSFWGIRDGVMREFGQEAIRALARLRHLLRPRPGADAMVGRAQRDSRTNVEAMFVERGCDGFGHCGPYVPGSYADFGKHCAELPRALIPEGLSRQEAEGENLGLKRPDGRCVEVQPR